MKVDRVTAQDTTLSEVFDLDTGNALLEGSMEDDEVAADVILDGGRESDGSAQTCHLDGIFRVLVLEIRRIPMQASFIEDVLTGSVGLGKAPRATPAASAW